jgi:hypothetical protein
MNVADDASPVAVAPSSATLELPIDRITLRRSI